MEKKEKKTPIPSSTALAQAGRDAAIHAAASNRMLRGTEQNIRRSAAPRKNPNSAAIRTEYERHGVKDFYATSGATYRNPHEHELAVAIKKIWKEWHLPTRNILDLAAGSGEATIALSSVGCTHIAATDPFTQEAYERRVGKRPMVFSFDDVVAGKLTTKYNAIICSYALHLVEESKLPALIFALSQIAPTLVVITPHKRPVLKKEWGYVLEKETVIERIRCRLYRIQQ